MKAYLKGVAQALIRRLVPAGETLAAMPVSRVFGLDRGLPIDRYYIQAFIDSQRDCINGIALEIAEPRYSLAFEGQLRGIEILHIDPKAKEATIIGDLSRPDDLPKAVANCFICTQTFQFIFDVAAALRGSAQLLRSGGTLLGTFSGISQISRYDMDRWGDYWRFTTASVERLASEAFPGGQVEVSSYGNLLAAKALLEGLSVEDVSDVRILDHHDPDYPVIIAVRARKA